MAVEILQRQTPPSTSYWAIGKLSLPVWISNLAIVGGGTIDTKMAASLGPTELAGVAVGIAVTISVFVALVGVMQGLSPIAGHHYGAGHHNRIGFELHQTLWLAVLLSVIGISLLCCTPIWMELTKSTGEVARVATSYLILNAIGLPGAMGGRAFTALNAAVSRPKIAMYISLLMLVLKAPFNELFIYGLGPIPAFGGAGCALSSATIGWLTLLLYWAIWHYDPFYKKMWQEKFSWPHWNTIVGQLKLGVPIGISSFFEVTSFTFMTIFISRLGPVVVSGHQIVANLTSLIYMLPLSIGVSTSVLVSQCLGAGSPTEARTATFRCLKLATFLAIITSATLYFCKYYFLSLYIDDKAVIAIAAALIGFASLYHVFDAINCIGSFAMRGYRITLVPMVIYGVLLWCMGLGLGSTLCFTDFFTSEPLGAEGYWTAITISLIASGVLVGLLSIYVANAVAHGRKVHIK